MILVLRNVFFLPIELQQKGILSRIFHPNAIKIGFVPLIVGVSRNSVVRFSVCSNDNNRVADVVTLLMKNR